MNMKKGFTLAELLGVIAILGIISLITVPLVNGSIEKSNEKLYQTQIKQIIKGAKSYYEQNLSLLPDDNEASTSVNLKTLQEAGYLPADIENPKTKKKYSGETKITVTNVKGEGEKDVYEYSVEEIME